MNEKYKIRYTLPDGTIKTVTESHPKLTATNQDKEDAATAVADVFGGSALDILLQSDTTVWQAS